jgi:hypothetical protein
MLKNVSPPPRPLRMSEKASFINDPVVLINRVLYRTGREIARASGENATKIRAGHNRADLKRALELLEDGTP